MSIKRLVIIPTYNENVNIKKIISEVMELKQEFYVLVIDDNSPDGTANTVKNGFSNNGRVFIITRSGKLGLGSAYTEGFKWAIDRGYERIFTMDADFSHQPKYLPGLDSLLEDNELSIGSRYIEGGGVEGWPLGRKLLSYYGNYYARTMIGIGIKDCTSGFMGITRALIEEFLKCDIKSEGYSFVIELKNTALKRGMAVKELPIIFVDRISGVSKISKTIIFEAFLLAIKLRFCKTQATGRGNRLFKLVDRYVGIPLVRFLGIFTKKGRQLSQNPGSILIIKLSAMGDSILLIPAIRALKQKYSKAEITVLCTNINAEIFKNCAYVDKTILCDIKKIVSKPFSVFSLLKKLKFDITIDFDQWLRFSPLLAFLSGAKARIGFKTEGQFRHYSYSAFVLHSRKKHEVECFMDLLGLLGITNADTSLEFKVGEEAKKKAGELFGMILLEENEPFIVLHPETPRHGAQRHWPAERYIELGVKITKDYRLKVLVTGTKDEIGSNVSIVSAIGPAAKLLPPADILTVAAAMSKAKAVICGNTGIMHLACALHRPVVAIHGPTDPAKWGPRGEKCRVVRAEMACSPCLYLGFEYGCDKNACMDAVSVENVLKNLKEVAFSS